MIAAGIVPTILGPVKPAIGTSGTIFVVLGVSGVAFASLGLWLTAVGVALQFVLWGIVLAQTFAARGAARDALAHPVDTRPALGFEEFAPEATEPGAAEASPAPGAPAA